MCDRRSVRTYPSQGTEAKRWHYCPLLPGQDILGSGLRHGIVKDECETRNEELLPGHFSTHHLDNPPSHGISACARACTCPLAQASSIANAKPFAMATDEHERRSSALTSQAHHSTWNTGLTRHRQPSLMRRARTSSPKRWVAEAQLCRFAHLGRAYQPRHTQRVFDPVCLLCTPGLSAQ